MKTTRVIFGAMSVMIMVACIGCFGKKIDWTQESVSGNTLILEFSRPLKYVMDIQVDGQDVPIRFSSKNKVLRVEGLTPGAHHFNVHSISYVFGPEFGRFHVSDEEGAYVFVLARKYRSALPKERQQVSIRAYHKMLKEKNILQEDMVIRAAFD